MKTCLLNLFVLWKKNRSSIIANNVIHEQRGFVSSLRLLLPNAPPSPLSSQLWFNTGHLFKMTYICRKSDMLDGESVMWHDPISAARRKKKGTASWMIHVSRLSNRIDEFSEYEQMRKKGNPITYRRVETLRKFRICMETEDGEGGKIRFRICIRWREKLSKRIYYCVN